MFRSRLLAALPALAVAPLLFPAPARAVSDPPCAPGIGVGLVDFPTGSKDPRAHTYVIDHVKPGAHFSRRFQVCNGTKRSVTVQLYPGAATVTNAAFRIVEGHARNELTSWISVAPASVTLLPGQRTIARATFTVSSQAQAGERYGVLLAELPPVPDAKGVQVASRVGVRVYLDVGPGGAPRSDFVVDSLQAARDAGGQGLVTAIVRNTGLRALDMTGSLSLRDGPGGLSGGPYPARLGTTLAPGQTEPVVVAIQRAVVDGPWTARLTLRSGLLERRVEAGLTFPDAPGEAAPPVDVEQLAPQQDVVVRSGAVWRTVAGVGAALLVLVALVALRRGRRAR